MQINIDGNLDNLEKFLDSVESEIGLDADQNIDANGSTTATTKKKEEKKLNIEYFGTDLTKESKDGFIDPII
jgi:ATP-dependent Clp protease ATP-binding subunit ClpA